MPRSSFNSPGSLTNTSVVVSSMTTGLIMARLLLARKKMQRIVGELGLGGTFKSTLPYGRVVTLLLEPALPFTLLGIVGAIATAFLDAETGEFNAANKATIVIYAIWCNSLVSPLLVRASGFTTDAVSGIGSSTYHLQDPIWSYWGFEPYHAASFAAFTVHT
jgi:hypothetical protein